MILVTSPTSSARSSLTPIPEHPIPKRLRPMWPRIRKFRAFWDYMATHPVHASYAEAPYFAIHTFCFTNADGDH